MLWILTNIDKLDPETVLRLLPVLSESRRERVLRMRHGPTRVQSVLAELLLRCALREEYGLRELPRIETGEKGKPFFPDRPDLHFNLSHCSAAVACALDTAPLGVDVQEVRSVCRDKHCLSTQPDEAVPRAGKTPPIYRVLSEPERAWVEAGQTPAEQDRRFTAVWTCKEAYGKALGCGIIYKLGSTCFIPESELWRQCGFLFRHFMQEKYALTLCSASALPKQSITPAELLSVSESFQACGIHDPL